jgi:hypothetical protein
MTSPFTQALLLRRGKKVSFIEEENDSAPPLLGLTEKSHVLRRQRLGGIHYQAHNIRGKQCF